MKILRHRSKLRSFRSKSQKVEKPDYGPPERWQHSGRVFEQTKESDFFTARATEEHIVDILVLMRILTYHQSAAAFRLKLDFQLAGLEAAITAPYNPISAEIDEGYEVPERSPYQEAAYQRWRNALRMLGSELSDPVLATVCLDHTPMPGKVPLLQRGLDRLVDWYHLAKKETARKAANANTKASKIRAARL